MEYVGLQKTHARLRSSGAPRDYHKYKHKLQLYDLPPIEEVSLEEFELFAVDRLKGMHPLAPLAECRKDVKLVQWFLCFFVVFFC